jgi:hypothetical protein
LHEACDCDTKNIFVGVMEVTGDGSASGKVNENELGKFTQD